MTENTTDIPQANQLLYVIKLRTGEELLCTLVDETQIGLLIDNPIMVKTVIVSGEDGVLRTEAVPQSWMPFALHRTFFIDMVDVAVYVPMHPVAHTTYAKMVNSLEVSITQTDSVETTDDLAPSERVYH